MKRTYQIISIAFLIFSFSSCSVDDLFDVKSDNSITNPSTLEDYQMLLDDAATFCLASPILYEVASDYHFVPEDYSANMSDAEINAYTWSHERPYMKIGEWAGNLIGRGAYKRIYQANLILDGLKKIERNSNPSLYDYLMGQALFHRGKAFFELSQMFSPPYEDSNKDQKFGIPLRLESDITIPSVRSTIGETYAQVMADLKTAANLLPTTPSYKTRPSKVAAYAMLARYFLAKGEYSGAEQNAEDALKLTSKLVNYNTLNFGDGSNPFKGYFDEVLFYSQAEDGYGFIFETAYIDSVFYKTYDDNDLRKIAFYRKDNESGLVTYRGSYSGAGFSNYFSGLAVDEVYLIRAECRVRKGDVTGAMKDLNSLLRTRWLGPYVDLAVGNVEDALKLILKERKKELIYRGVRWSDLRRLNKDPRFAIKLSRRLSGRNYEIEPNSYQYTFPLPDDVVQITGMQQNPGW